LAAPIVNHAPTVEASTRMHSLGRIGTPEDIAHAIQFLLESTWTTGQTLVVDGGLSGTKLPR
ncbi:MAG: SDR family oxidoreductase, partial [Myxococcota bacterium]|nr:SDR family oxidoreductase [Myxococcota bacterium]